MIYGYCYLLECLLSRYEKEEREVAVQGEKEEEDESEKR